MPAVAIGLEYLLDDHTAIVTLQNGIPWRYFHKHPGPYRDLRLKSVDPLNNLSQSIDADRIIGCVAYPAAELMADGSVRHKEGPRFPVGKLDEVTREWTEILVRAFEANVWHLEISFRHTIEKRTEGAKAVGPHKTSMLCDPEAGRTVGVGDARHSTAFPFNRPRLAVRA